MIQIVEKAVVLAAGFGTRLRPYTDRVPKALMPLWGIPMLERALQMLENWGVREIAINAHAHADQIEEFVKARKGKAKLRVSVEKEILGTGGALKPLQKFIGNNPFWMLNADVAAAVDPEPLKKAFESSGNFAAVWLDNRRGPRTVETDFRGRTTCFKSPTPGVDETATLCGLHLLSAEILKYLPEAPFSSIVEAYERAMYEERFAVGSIQKDAYWADCGTPTSWLAAHGEIKALALAGKLGGELYSKKFDRLPDSKKKFFCLCPGAKAPAKPHEEQAVVVPVDLAVPAFSEKHLGSWKGAQLLGVRGSSRAFWRLYNAQHTGIGLVWNEERPENDRYCGHTSALEKLGVPVPEILGSDTRQHLLVLEDFGDDSLYARVKDAPWKALALYTPVVKAVAHFHRAMAQHACAGRIILEPGFNEKLYAWERNLFATHLLKDRYGINALPTNAEDELKEIAKRLMAEPDVVIHRDLQSTNVLMRGKKFVFIDYQGMRLGSAAYDLASLLYDPYVTIPPGDREALARIYAQAFPEQAKAAEENLPLGAIQRLVQALGAYGRLASVGQPQFTRHILPALKTLHDLAEAQKLKALAGLTHQCLDRERMRVDRAREANEK